MGNCNDEQGKVSGAEDVGGNENGGFMAGTHKMHRTSYGPDSPLPAKAKVFGMIQHHLIANWQIRMAIPNSVIAKETGVESQLVKRTIKFLEKEKMILVERRKLGTVHQDNIYRLHPMRFGVNPLYQGAIERPTFQVIPGGKIVDINRGGSGQNATTPSGQNATTPSGQNATTKPPLEQPPERIPASDKNVLRTIKNKPTVQVELKGLSWNETKSAILSEYPNDTHRLDKAYQTIKADGEFKGTQIYKPEGFILKCWQAIRGEFSFVDDLIKKKTEVKSTDEPFDQQAADAAREIVMSSFRKNLALSK